MFVLRQENHASPPGWEIKDLSQYQLLYKDSFPVYPLVDKNHTNIGWVLGYPINIKKQMFVTGSHQIQIDESSSAQDLEQEIYRLGGRYIVIVNRAGSMRAYLDSAGSLSLVL